MGREQPQPHRQHRQQPQTAVKPISPNGGQAVAHHDLRQHQRNQGVADVGGPDQSRKGEANHHHQREQQQQLELQSPFALQSRSPPQSIYPELRSGSFPARGCQPSELPTV